MGEDCCLLDELVRDNAGLVGKATGSVAALKALGDTALKHCAWALLVLCLLAACSGPGTWLLSDRNDSLGQFLHRQLSSVSYTFLRGCTRAPSRRVGV